MLIKKRKKHIRQRVADVLFYAIGNPHARESVQSTLCASACDGEDGCHAIIKQGFGLDGKEKDSNLL